MIMKASYQQQFLSYVLLLTRGVGSVAAMKIYTAIKQAGIDDHYVGYMLHAGKLDEIAHLFGRNAEHVSAVLRTSVRTDFELLLADGQFPVCPFDSLLPQYYWDRAVSHRLPLLFIARGTPPPTDRTWIAVIGSRNANEDGLQRARAAGARNALDGHVTVSGGAKGVDLAATTAATEASGMTVIVPAGDVSSVRRTDHQLVLSPYAPGTHFSPGIAMARNAVVVSLSQSVIVAEVQSGANGALSGTQHAISMAKDYGVPVTLATSP